MIVPLTMQYKMFVAGLNQSGFFSMPSKTKTSIKCDRYHEVSRIHGNALLFTVVVTLLKKKIY